MGKKGDFSHFERDIGARRLIRIFQNLLISCHFHMTIYRGLQECLRDVRGE